MCERRKCRGVAAIVLAVCSIGGAAPATNPAGTLAANDLIKVGIADLIGPGMVTPVTIRLDEKGRATLPMIKDIDLHGLTTDVAAAQISKAYTKAAVMQNAVVTVAIVETAAQSKIKFGPLRAGDHVDITVFDLTGPGVNTTVNAVISGQGTVELPLVKPVALVGQSEGAATRTVAKAYRDANIISNATVIVCRTG